MNREEKKNIIDSLSVKLKEGNSIYFTKIHGLDAVQTASLRRLCFERDVSLLVVKNRLLRKAMEVQKDKDFSDFFDLLKENTSLMISESSKAPAKIIKDFLDKNGTETPLLKGAHIDNEIYLGHEKLDLLSNLKSREELIGDVLGLLQSPMKNLVSALNSGSNNISGLLKSLADNNGNIKNSENKENSNQEEVSSAEEAPDEELDKKEVNGGDDEKKS